MKTTDRLVEATGERNLPFAMLLARRSEHDFDVFAERKDGLAYVPDRQVNIYEGDPLSMGRSTCFRRSSTGILFIDDDRAQDD